jgi:hypothetical protein
VLHLTSRGHAAFGFRFRFESDDPLLAEVVARCYRDLPVAGDAPHVLRAARGAGEGFRVTIESVDGTVEECGDGRQRSSVLELICWEVNRRAMASMAQRTVLHAAVVAGPAGAIALCGPSHSGKSTLAAAAAVRGWRHLSDDMGLIDVDALTIAPYARPLMLRPGGRQLIGPAVAPPVEHLQFFSDDWFVPASELGATVGDDPVPLVAIGFLGWDTQAALTPITRAETLHDLTLHCGTLAPRGADGFDELHRVAASVPGFRVGLGATSDVLDLLAPLLRITVE